MKFLSAIVLSFLLSQQLVGQDCGAIFKQVLGKVKSDRNSVTDNGLLMSLRVRVTMNDGKIHSEDMTIALKGEKYKYSSKSMNLYQDEKVSVVVNSNDNSILITKSDPLLVKSNVYDQMNKLQDSVANYFDVKSCDKEWGLVDKNTGYYKMVLLPTEKLKGLGVNSIVYAVSTDKMEVRRINVYYDPEIANGIKEYEMLIADRNSGKVQYPFTGTAVGVVMTDGKLKNDYSGYSVIDKRN